MMNLYLNLQAVHLEKERCTLQQSKLLLIQSDFICRKYEQIAFLTETKYCLELAALM